MKEVTLSPLNLGPLPLPRAFDVAFDERVLRTVHGPGALIGAWQDNDVFGGVRRLQFTMPVSMPKELRRFFCGDEVRISCTQRKRVPADGQAINVTNAVRMHFVGAELFKVRPSFVLWTDAHGTSWLRPKVEVRVRLPPPLNMVAEAAMAEHSERELTAYVAAVHEACNQPPAP